MLHITHSQCFGRCCLNRHQLSSWVNIKEKLRLTSFLKSISIKSDFSHLHAHRSRKREGHGQRGAGCDSYHISPRGDRGLASISPNHYCGTGTGCRDHAQLQLCHSRVQHVPHHRCLSLLFPTNAERWTSTSTFTQAIFPGSAEATKALQIPLVPPCPRPRPFPLTSFSPGRRAKPSCASISPRTQSYQPQKFMVPLTQESRETDGKGCFWI